MPKTRFAQWVQYDRQPVDIEAYTASIKGITAEIKTKEYELFKYNSRQIKKHRKNIDRLKYIRAQMKEAIEQELEIA